MFFRKDRSIKQAVTFDEKPLKAVRCFTYFESEVSKQGTILDEISKQSRRMEIFTKV